MPLFRKVLVANRGEIAVRVIRTCRVLGIPTVAVYSEADRTARHVREADEAVAIGPAEARESYLSIDGLLGAARATGADAVHPGYGFLSQSGDFADAVKGAGLVFVGPPGDVHRRMGDKRASRRADGGGRRPRRARLRRRRAVGRAAPRRGAPDRLAADAQALPRRRRQGHARRAERGGLQEALAASRREARGAFGDDAMVLERFVERPRHVEVQVMADAQGGIVHLGERECSVQRRHQKVVEETPSPALSPAQREALCAAGVAAARAAGYVNAGTVEFLLSPDGSFSFLEMNTRLQVEHPVTEAVSGLDLVRLQLEVAAGRPLPLAQPDVALRGHALECRLYAEDPHHDDLPSPGRVLHLSEPEGPGIRVDSGLDVGSEVSVHYDPLLSKIVTWGQDRPEAIERMRDALRRTVVLGVVTNIARLRAIVEHPAFAAGELHTGFIEEHLSELVPSPCPPLEAIAAAAAALGRRGTLAPEARRSAPDPWASLGAWRLGEER